jgi:quercetin dioxygenase-like cupin family protein
MNLKDLFTEDKPLQTKKLFTATDGVISIQIKAGGQLKEHTTNVVALLICVTGEVVFENEKGTKEILFPGGYVNIEPMIKHSVKGIQDSQLLLIK